ncbi:MAG: putative ABC transporter permease [Ruthenibacterium sp.]
MSVTEKNGAVQLSEPQSLPDTAKGEGDKMPKKRRRREKKPRAPMKENPDSFAAGKNMYKLIWVFFIGCILGYCAEMVFAYAKNGTWVNRQGLLYGPFNQIYGMGAVLFTITLYRLRNANGVLVFVASAIAGSAFEWMCSFAQEMLFGCVSWEYSDTPANLGGRTNLFFAICWGVMGFLFIRNLYPYLSERIERIPNKIGKTLTVIIAVFMGVNILLSAAAVTRQSARKQGEPPLTILGECLDRWYPDEFLAKVYTSMEFVE